MKRLIKRFFRELEEELGLLPRSVDIIVCTCGWLRYTLPRRFVRRNTQRVCIGQKQVWFLLRLLTPEHDVRLDATSEPEFDHWKWVNYWRPAKEVVYFKRHVYRRALKELAPLVPGGMPASGGTRVLDSD